MRSTVHEDETPLHRPRVVGKFLFAGKRKLYVRGVTYGPFRPDAAGCEYPDAGRVENDFDLMAAAGVNAIRTYTVPPGWLLDAAWSRGLRVLAGLPWEQHVAFLGDRTLPRRIENRVRDGVRACAGHPALLGFAIGNEVPSSVVRWHGHRRVERHIKRLYHIAKTQDPDALVSYVNYPSTEYLDLPFVDMSCFNVYLEGEQSYTAYLHRLQNLAGDKPLIIAETGLDSRRHGETAQARAIDWQIRATFAAGCAGIFIFSWTDEWYRGGADIEDWDFGLTTRTRLPKPALAAARAAFAEVPFPAMSWPHISVVVCTHKGARTVRDCLAGLRAQSYPNYEVILINDGADEAVAAIAREFPVRLLNLPHAGLSAARNAGAETASGEIVAYIDDDAVPDPDWLYYLAHDFCTTDFAAIGGPNIPPATRWRVPHCIACAPGGPMHVLLSDREAEHIPGCNMAFRKSALRRVGGFDPRFRVAGDDVDICWQMQDAGLRIGFSPGAVVWHHRRQRLREYWRQQVGYGRAEALLERKFPTRYSESGQPAWRGRIYSGRRAPALIWGRPRVYHGTWGSAAFQSVYAAPIGHIWTLAFMSEWYLMTMGLALLSLLAPLWEPLGYLRPMLAVMILIPTLLAAANAVNATLSHSFSRLERAGMRMLIWALHLAQPLARLWGRLRLGLTPWRARGLSAFAMPGLRSLSIWSEQWRSPTEWIERIESKLRVYRVLVQRGGVFDRWDMEVPGSIMGGVRMRVLVEEHGAGKQLVRIQSWPHCSLPVAVLLIGTMAMTIVSATRQAWDATAVFGVVSLLSVVASMRAWGFATGHLFLVLRKEKDAAEKRGPAPQVESVSTPPVSVGAPPP